jgi:adenosine deaminase
MRDLSALPKAELHIHLEGSTRIKTIRELSDSRGLPLPSGLEEDGWKFSGFLDFIDQYVAICSLITDADDLRRVAYELCEDLAGNGVRYAETIFSLPNHSERLGDWDAPTEAVLDGLAIGRRDFGPVVRLLPCLVRDEGLESAERALEAALKYIDAGVVGLNAAGSERTSIEPFADVFRKAKSAGLRSVPHAGEWAGPANIWETLQYYSPDRVGHGVRAVEDPRLVEHLAAEQIPLEVSPVSNVATGVFDSMVDHPFDELRRAGVLVTLNSDDPPMFGAWLGSVYETVRETWGYDDQAMAEIARAGVRASFADDDVKRTILEDIDLWLTSEPIVAG